MPLNSIKDLPKGAQRMWESVFKEMKKKHSESRAAKIAWGVVRENYKSARRTGKKSVAVSQPSEAQSTETSTFIDVMLGYPDIDRNALDGDFLLDPRGWERKPVGVLKGDMEHFYSDKAEGLYIDADEKWEGFVPVIQRFWHDGDGSLWGRAELPETHPETESFLQEWNEGKYGVSIEYAGNEDDIHYTWVDHQLVPVLPDWHITGFTFTKEPSYEGTNINKNGENTNDREEE